MLSYRHAFHAGNFADVMKHVVLTMLLRALCRKDKAFVYLDTHAGAGRYDLRSEMAMKNREFRSGIARVWTATNAPDAVTAYLDAVRAANAAMPPPSHAPGTEAIPHWYPGSPRLARHFLRRCDRMVLGEMHSGEAPRLAHEFAGDRAVQVVRADGYQLLKSHLPPRERRGLVLIDPSYERRHEANEAFDALQDGYRRWATGIYALWYPIMPKIPVASLQRRAADSGIRRILAVELCIYPDDNPLGMNGSGMLIVNPPFGINDELGVVLPWLWQALAHERQGRQRVQWLVPE